ncbi:proteasome subunit beta [Haloprofundus salilacus]|uniref:proteasome subunit beta n=1 Tax=Haloprofundus salilacus TaxID=2876190 RepID=UPI001CCBEEB0|nr:proteasome subunit beta [Haloprofundus salilacus]
MPTEHETDAGESSAGDSEFSTGTTIVGLAAADAVVLATDRRVSLGGMVSSKSTPKALPVGDRAAVAFSGTLSGAQALADELATEARLYELRRGDPISTTALASYTSNLLRENPMGVMPLLGGVDGVTDAALYQFDGGGGLTEHDAVAAGSGGPYAYGLLESVDTGDLDADEARILGARAVAAASERDLASGNGLCLATVTESGVEIEQFDDTSAVGS